MNIKINNSIHPLTIDDEDFETLAKIGNKIYYSSQHGQVSIYQNGLSKTYSVARIIMGCKRDDGYDIDHIDGNRLNNRKNNLRKCTHAQNCANRVKSCKSSSKYKGVSWDKTRKKWQASITYNKRSIGLGRYDDEILAAIAYDDAALLYHGEFARTNFPLAMY